MAVKRNYPNTSMVEPHGPETPDSTHTGYAGILWLSKAQELYLQSKLLFSVFRHCTGQQTRGGRWPSLSSIIFQTHIHRNFVSGPVEIKGAVSEAYWWYFEKALSNYSSVRNSENHATSIILWAGVRKGASSFKPWGKMFKRPSSGPSPGWAISVLWGGGRWEPCGAPLAQKDPRPQRDLEGKRQKSLPKNFLPLLYFEALLRKPVLFLSARWLCG